MIKIKEHLDQIDNYNFEPEHKKGDVIEVIKIALSILIILLKAYMPLIRKEEKRERFKKWIAAIETGTLISQIIKP
jgi:hypothetical protein